MASGRLAPPTEVMRAQGNASNQSGTRNPADRPQRLESDDDVVLLLQQHYQAVDSPVGRAAIVDRFAGQRRSPDAWRAGRLVPALLAVLGLVLLLTARSRIREGLRKLVDHIL